VIQIYYKHLTLQAIFIKTMFKTKSNGNRKGFKNEKGSFVLTHKLVGWY